MSLTAIVKALISAGATSEMILAAVEADENSRKQDASLKRENARQRQNKSRNNNDRVTVTPVTECDKCDSPLDGSDGFPNPSLTSLNPTKENPPKGGQKKNPHRDFGTRLSKDWDLPDDWGEWAEQLGMTREAIIRECDKFKDFWIAKSGKDATKRDWEATWRNWIRRHLEDYAK